MVVRVAIGWFVSINPYVFPLSYLVMFVDWIDEVISNALESEPMPLKKSKAAPKKSRSLKNKVKSDINQTH